MKITRRSLLAGMGAGVLLAACRDDVPLEPIRPAGATKAAPTPTTRVVVVSSGAPTTRAAGQPSVATGAPAPAADAKGGQRLVEQFLGQQKGKFAVAARDFAGQSSVEIAPRDLFELASLYKVVLMAEVMRRVAGGELGLTDRIRTAPDYGFGEPEGGVPPDTQLSIDEAIGAMIRVSSNGAALALIDRIGEQAVEAAPGRFGMGDTTIDVASGSGPGHYLVEAHGSARDLAELFLKLGRGQVVSRALDARMAGYLLGQTIDDRLPALLPPGTPIAHKTGELDDLTHDAGMVYLPGRPYAVAVLAQAAAPGEGRAIVAEVSRILYGWYGGGGR
jgi:beta-lactamase class A